MGISSSMLLLFLLLLLPLSLLSQPSHSITILVNGVSEWKNPNVYIGDSVIFKHKYHYNLYIFQNQLAFNLCNFTQATLLTKPNSTSFTWHPSRPGVFYFTFNNGSLKSCNQDSQKLSIKVSTAPPPPVADSLQFPPMASPPVPAPTPGNAVSSSPAYQWPFRPREASASSSSPAPAPISNTANSPMTTTVPKFMPDKGGGAAAGGGMPFINSNPAVPLPTGEIDSATVRPLLISGHHQLVHSGSPFLCLLCALILTGF